MIRTKFKHPLKSSDETHPNFQGHYDPTPGEIAGIKEGAKEIAKGNYITSDDWKKTLKK